MTKNVKLETEKKTNGRPERGRFLFQIFWLLARKVLFWQNIWKGALGKNGLWLKNKEQAF